MILKMLRPKTDIRRPPQRAKQRITSLTLPRIEPPATAERSCRRYPGAACSVARLHHRPARRSSPSTSSTSSGLPGIFVLMVAESACIPIPSEATMLFAGFNVAEGEYSLFAVVARRRGRERRRLVDRLRDRLLRPRRPAREARRASCTSSRRTSQWADDWFERYGDATVFFSRMLPIIRTFISLPAGVARMPFWRFTVLTVARLHPVGLHARVHRQAGRRQLGAAGRTTCTTSTTRWSRLIVLGVVWLFVRYRRRRAPARAAADAA